MPTALRIDHSTHTHDATARDRAACRRIANALWEYAWLGDPEERAAEVRAILNHRDLIAEIDYYEDQAADASHHRAAAIGDEARSNPLLDAVSMIYETHDRDDCPDCLELP